MKTFQKIFEQKKKLILKDIFKNQMPVMHITQNSTSGPLFFYCLNHFYNPKSLQTHLYQMRSLPGGGGCPLSQSDAADE